MTGRVRPAAMLRRASSITTTIVAIFSFMITCVFVVGITLILVVVLGFLFFSSVLFFSFYVLAVCLPYLPVSYVLACFWAHLRNDIVTAA